MLLYNLNILIESVSYFCIKQANMVSKVELRGLNGVTLASYCKLAVS
jgi:hypothetical protein